MAKRTVVQVGEKHFETKPNGRGGLGTDGMKDDDVQEEILLGDGLAACLNNDLNKTVNEAYKELRSQLKEGLKATVMSIMGFRGDSWSRKWEVDNCNGRSSAVTQYLSESMSQLLREEIKKITDEEKAELMKEIRPAIRQELRRNFMEQVRRETYQTVTTASKEFLKELMDKEMKKVKKKATELAVAAMTGQKVSYNDQDGAISFDR